MAKEFDAPAVYAEVLRVKQEELELVAEKRAEINQQTVAKFETQRAKAKKTKSGLQYLITKKEVALK